MGRRVWIWGVLLACVAAWYCMPGSAGDVLAQPTGPAVIDSTSAESTEGMPLGLPAQEFGPLGGGVGATPGASSPGGLTDTFAALAMVVGLVVVLAAAYKWIVAKSGGLQGQLGTARSPAGLLDVLGRYPIARGQSLLLLRMDRRVLLVSQTAGSRVGSAPTLRTLCEVDDPDEVASLLAKASPGERFEESFARASLTAEPRASRAMPPAAAANTGVEVVDLTRGSGFMGRLSGIVGGRS